MRYGKLNNQKKMIQDRVANGDLLLTDMIGVVSSVPVFNSGDSIEITYDKYGFYKDPSIQVNEMTVKEYLESN